MRFGRWILRLTLALVALASGYWFKGIGGQLAYGIDPPPHDPSVKLVDFSYIPSSPARPGDTLTFTITANKESAHREGHVTVRLGSPQQLVAGVADGYIRQGCNDNGFHPDAVAGDGIFTGSTILPASVIPQTDIPVTAYLHWNDYKPAYELHGEPLDIEEAE